MAQLLVRVDVPARAAVVREGDPGERFYLIAEGEAVVTLDGRTIATVGAGDSFGEIALLRDVPRTATVRALTAVELLALEPEDFVAAVTGHAPSREAADAVIATRIGPLVPV